MSFRCLYFVGEGIGIYQLYQIGYLFSLLFYLQKLVEKKNNLGYFLFDLFGYVIQFLYIYFGVLYIWKIL